jgi:predicted regulator of amino acid metabolism with ACT domain
MTNKPFDTELIPKENFREMIKQKNVVRTPAGHGGIIHDVKRILEQNAATLDAIAIKLGIDRKTVYNAINHLKQRYNCKITRYYNPKDRRHYYFMSDNDVEKN